MNERMIELYKQAHVPLTAYDPSNNMPYETSIFSVDKYTELMVEEFQTILRNNRGQDTGTLSYRVEEHFGVEE